MTKSPLGIKYTDEQHAADAKAIRLALGEARWSLRNVNGATVYPEPGGRWRIADEVCSEVYENTAAALAAAPNWAG